MRNNLKEGKWKTNAPKIIRALVEKGKFTNKFANSFEKNWRGKHFVESINCRYRNKTKDGIVKYTINLFAHFKRFPRNLLAKRSHRLITHNHVGCYFIPHKEESELNLEFYEPIPAMLSPEFLPITKVIK